MALVTELFPDFQSALAVCGSGYNDEAIADVIAYKTSIPVDPKTFVPDQALISILSVAIAGAERGDRTLNVIDFGGGCGFHYFRVVAATRIPLLRWAIVETPVMANRAAKVAQGRFETFTDLNAAAESIGRIDLIHASGTILYIPDPVAALETIARLRPQYFALARFPVWGLAKLVAVQPSPLSANGIGPMPPTIADRQVKYPITFINLDDVMRVFSAYDIVLVYPSKETYMVRDQHVPEIALLFRSK